MLVSQVMVTDTVQRFWDPATEWSECLEERRLQNNKNNNFYSSQKQSNCRDSLVPRLSGGVLIMRGC